PGAGPQARADPGTAARELERVPEPAQLAHREDLRALDPAALLDPRTVPEHDAGRDDHRAAAELDAPADPRAGPAVRRELLLGGSCAESVRIGAQLGEERLVERAVPVVGAEGRGKRALP